MAREERRAYFLNASADVGRRRCAPLAVVGLLAQYSLYFTSRAHGGGSLPVMMTL